MIFEFSYLDSAYRVNITLLKGVKDHQILLKEVISGRIQASLIKPHLISDLDCLKIAIYKSIKSMVDKTLRCKSVYSEIIFNLSPSNHISETLKVLGIGDSDKDLLAIEILNLNGQLQDWLIYADEVQQEFDINPDVDALSTMFKVQHDELTRNQFLKSIKSMLAIKSIQ